RIALGFAARRTERLRGLALLDSRLGDVDPALAVRWRGRIAGGRDGRGYPTRAAALAAFRFVPDEPGVAPDTRALLAHHAIRARPGRLDVPVRSCRAVAGRRPRGRPVAAPRPGRVSRAPGCRRAQLGPGRGGAPTTNRGAACRRDRGVSRRASFPRRAPGRGRGRAAPLPPPAPPH